MTSGITAERMTLGITVEEADDVGKVHLVVDDDLAVVLDQREGDEEDKVGGAYAARRPDRLPDAEHILIHQLYNTRVLMHQLYNTRVLIHQLYNTRVLVHQLYNTRVLIYQLYNTRVLIHQLYNTRVLIHQLYNTRVLIQDRKSVV